MGLTSDSTGRPAAAKAGLQKADDEQLVILAGNPNVGKSTVFNALTGMKQHTGNWAGKTVSSAAGRFRYSDKKFLLADIPGTYSLAAESEEEKAARDVICFEKSDAAIIVCSASCLERNLGLVLQILEVSTKALVCVNLLDEAERKNISVDINALSESLGVPAVGVCAKVKKGLDTLANELSKLIDAPAKDRLKIDYDERVEKAAEQIQELTAPYLVPGTDKRWAALRLMENENDIKRRIIRKDAKDISEKISEIMSENSLDCDTASELISKKIMEKSREICEGCISFGKRSERDLKIDRVITSRLFGIPIMLGLLALIFWLTAVGSNYPSALLSRGTSYLGELLDRALRYINCADIVRDMAVNGVYKVLAWVVSVMLPPMAIFFPLFTLLEDIGYLPRAAFMLDGIFSRFGGCGKQSLTMAMGIGCNAAGVTGCRIIGSQRERLTAILTNSFMPCNGRFPTLIFLINVFFSLAMNRSAGGGLSAVILLIFILMGVSATLLVSLILSKTVFRGKPSSFILELPPYRVPQIGKVIVRSVFDRTIFVLARACAAAAPAGLLIWLLANLSIGSSSILQIMADLLDPIGAFLGMDGVILLGFILGFPANEIVLPIIVMGYLSAGTLTETSDAQMLNILISSGWTSATAVCTALFTLFHFPCSTTCLTVKKETASIKYTLAAIAIPTVFGALLCALVNAAAA